MTDVSFAHGVALFEKGQFNQALSIFDTCYAREPTDEVAAYLLKCRRRLARLLWRQQRSKELKLLSRNSGNEDVLSLAVARLEGKKSCAQLASAGSFLAACMDQKEVQQGLLALRQSPEFKTLAEGWLMLLKGDDQRALELFCREEQRLPFQARLGIGTAYLLLGERDQALPFFEAIRPFPKWFVHLPSLFSKPPFREREKLQQIAYCSTLETLKQIEPTIPSHLKRHKGLLYLKMGDALASREEKEAFSYWKQAATLSPALRLDVFKRTYLLCYTVSVKHPYEAFFDFYNALNAHAPGGGREFVEHLVFDSSRSIENILAHWDLRDECGTWLFDNRLVELKLLWLHVFYRERALNLQRGAAIPRAQIEKDLTFSLNDWSALFSLLDPLYGNKEIYLQYKLGVALLLDHPQLARAPALQLLLLNPHLKDEILPHYCKMAWRTVSAGAYDSFEPWVEANNIVRREITQLLALFPTHFDLLRLSYQTILPPAEKRVEQFASALPKPLFEVFKLQCTLDDRAQAAQCKRLIPPLHTLMGHQEAANRLFCALCTPHFKIAQQDLSSLFHEIAPSPLEKHRLLKLARGLDCAIPLSLLLSWKKRDPRTCYPHYHLASHYCLNGNRTECVKAIDQGLKYAPLHSEEREALIISQLFYFDPLSSLTSLFNSL